MKHKKIPYENVFKNTKMVKVVITKTVTHEIELPDGFKLEDLDNCILNWWVSDVGVHIIDKNGEQIDIENDFAEIEHTIEDN